ncbi:MAG: hypothetical protein V3R99_06850, partial [Thermoguttaceae bacterium]
PSFGSAADVAFRTIGLFFGRTPAIDLFLPPLSVEVSPGKGKGRGKWEIGEEGGKKKKKERRKEKRRSGNNSLDQLPIGIIGRLVRTSVMG